MSEKKPQVEPQAVQGSLMADILADALAIQDRFAAEPMLKSRGVDGLKQDANELRKMFGHATHPKN